MKNYIPSFEEFLNESESYQSRSMLMPGSTKDEDLDKLRKGGLRFKIHIEDYMQGDYEVEFYSSKDAEKAEKLLESQLNEGVKKHKGREVYPEWIDPKRDFGAPVKALKDLRQGAEYILWEPGMDCWQAEFIYNGKKGGMHTFTSTTQMDNSEPVAFNEPDLLDYIKSGDIIKQN